MNTKLKLCTIYFLITLLSYSSLLAANSQQIAEQRAQQWVQMLNNNLTITELTKNNFSQRFIDRTPSSRINMIFTLFKRFYKNKAAKLEEIEITAGAVIVRLSNFENKWAEYELQFEPDDSNFLIGGFNAKILGIRVKNDWQNLSEKELLSKTEKFLFNLSIDKDFSGSIIIAKSNNQLLNQNFGNTNQDIPTKINSDTAFPIASISKSITAIAVALLVSEQKLDLDKTLSSYLPNLSNLQLRNQVTPRQLLMHTSGMESMLFIDDFPTLSKDASIETSARAIAKRPLVDKAGANYRYSNAGPFILALLIEKISGQNFQDFVQQRIFDKTKMFNSGFLYAGNYPDTVAVATIQSGNSEHVISGKSLFDTPFAPGGSIYSSTSDMLKLSTALYQSKLFGETVLSLLISTEIKISNQASYTAGLMKRHLGSSFALGHTGGLPGISAQWWYLNKGDYQIIILSNQSAIAADIADRLLVALSTVKDK